MNSDIPLPHPTTAEQVQFIRDTFEMELLPWQESVLYRLNQQRRTLVVDEVQPMSQSDLHELIDYFNSHKYPNKIGKEGAPRE
jgi:hypothetical protein